MALTPAQTAFRNALLVQLENKEAVMLLDASIGYFFDVLYVEIENEHYNGIIRNMNVSIKTTNEPDGVMIECGDYGFEFDQLTLTMADSTYLDESNVMVGSPTLISVVACVLDVLFDMLAEYDIKPSELDNAWEG